MSAYWDFRCILDVYPEESRFTCVGTNKKGARCGQRMFSGLDILDASITLDKMDRHRKLSSSYKYLEELAELTLCPRWHQKPGYSQVDSIAAQWRRTISKFAVKMEREQEKAAMAESKRALKAMKESIVEIKLELEEDEIKEKAPVSKDLDTKVKEESDLPTLATLEAHISMVATVAAPKTSITEITPPSSPNNTPHRVLERIEAAFALKTTSALASQTYTLPPLPAPPLELKGLSSDVEAGQSPSAAPTEAISERISTITKTASIEVTQTTKSDKIAPKTVLRENSKMKTFNFEFPPTPDTTPQSKSHLAYEFRAEKQAPPPGFDLGITATLPTSLPVAKQPRFGLHTRRFQTNDNTPAFNNPEYKVPSRSFDFATTVQLPSYKEDPFVSTSACPSRQLAEAAKAPQFHTRLGLITPEATPEPESHSNEPEECYGYAIVAPASMRYKSYLPCHQHGLAISETRREDVEDPFLAFISEAPSPVTALLEKHLPLTPTLVEGEEGPDICESCGVEGGCDCWEEENGRVGCFSSSRLRKLRKRAARKLHSFKTKASGVLRR